MKRFHLFFLLVFAASLIACGTAVSVKPRPTAALPIVAADGISSLATRPPATSRPATPTRPAQINGFDTIALSELPQEALDTLALIERGGPFPYRQDGRVFQNRERILPRKSSAYYHEYTVETPGSDDRGARRIITGQEGELYYTDDHYESFKVIIDDE
ncbi:MAG: ribonuclease [Anaerolineae bacterium]|nr:ribonuclease [Anaerolineae bacterium]